MAVYEHSYKPYDGVLTPAWPRFLVLPKYAYESVFKSKFAIGFLAICGVAPLIYTILIYLNHNLSALQALGLPAGTVIPITADFFAVFVWLQTVLGFLFTVVNGPVLMSRDLANNALPLYLCRPFTRWEYVAGKAAVLLFVWSVITWIPGLLLFLFQSYLAGGGWFTNNLWIGRAILISSLAWSISWTLLAMAFSAWIKWRTAASAALFAIWVIPFPIAAAMIDLFRTQRGFLFDIAFLLGDLTYRLFGNPPEFKFALWEIWTALACFALVSLWMISRKLRAYEVVS
jgi:ABC-type transport system involved in multi-copper enzyme maturation permease subunit